MAALKYIKEIRVVSTLQVGNGVIESIATMRNAGIGDQIIAASSADFGLYVYVSQRPPETSTEGRFCQYTASSQNNSPNMPDSV